MSLPDSPTAAPGGAGTPDRTPDTGVIHDIGYRAYGGPRLGRSYATRSLFVQSLRSAYGLGRSGKSKVLPMLMLALPVLVSAVVVIVAILNNESQLGVDYPQFFSSVGILVWIFAAAQAPVLLSRDLRYNTVPLYFSRPITRGDYVRAKFGAMVCAMLIITVTPLVVLYLGSILAKQPLGHNTAHFAYGLLAALLYSLVYSAIGLVIAASTPRRGFGVAAIMGVLVVSNILSGIVYALSGGIGRNMGTTIPESANWSAVLSPSELVAGFVNKVCGLVTDPIVIHAPGALGTLVFAAEIIVIVGASYWFLGRRFRKI